MGAAVVKEVTPDRQEYCQGSVDVGSRLQALAFDHACSRDDTHRRHVFRYYSARPDNRATADGHSGCDRGGGADPDIVLDNDRGVSDEVVALIEFDGVGAAVLRVTRGPIRTR